MLLTLVVGKMYPFYSGDQNGHTFKKTVGVVLDPEFHQIGQSAIAQGTPSNS